MEDRAMIDIYKPHGDGYQVQHRFGGWRVAYLCYAEKFDRITYLERHLETDEIFVLLQGEATLLIGENAQRVAMEKGQMYNVPKATWHNIRVSRDAQVLIVENEDTGKHNSEYMDLPTAVVSQ